MSARLMPVSDEIPFRVERVFESLSGSFASQSFWGERETLAPFAPEFDFLQKWFFNEMLWYFAAAFDL